MTEKELWKLVEDCNWKLDHDYERISGELKKLPKEIFNELDNFICDKQNHLYSIFKKDWLGDPGIDCGDDSFSDLLFEVVGRGELFYNSITTDKLIEMADNFDYHESFVYCLQD